MNARRTLTTAARRATRPAQAARAAPTAAASEDVSADRAALRHELIAVGAYYLAEKRDFAPGAELDDWLTAEAQVEAMGGEARPNNPRPRSP